MKYSTLGWHLRRDNPAKLQLFLDRNAKNDGPDLKNLGWTIFRFKAEKVDDVEGWLSVEQHALGYFVGEYDIRRVEHL